MTGTPVKTLYFDCFSGISGDMTIGALIDVGVDFGYLRSEIGKLGLDGFELRCTRVVRANLSASKFDVLIDGDSDGGGTHLDSHEHLHAHVHSHDHGHTHGSGHPKEPERQQPAGAHSHGHHAHTSTHVHRKASDIIAMIRSSALTAPVRERATSIFEKLAVSEGRVHHMPPGDVQFHEVGAIDSIVDIVGTAVGIEALGVAECVASPVNVGAGFIQCQHGIYPVPPPATSNLLEGVPVYSKHADRELVTPTGAAILAATVHRFERLGPMTIDRVGYGAGTRDLGEFPNCLRVFLGTREAACTGPLPRTEDTVVVIEANVDDMSAEQLAWSAEKLLGSGALDVVTIPVQMKKGRPGHLLQIIARPEDEEFLTRICFEETSTIGVRVHPMTRRVLERALVDVPTAFGTIRVKVARRLGRTLNASPEYEDCARIARETGRPFHHIREEALRAYRETQANE